VIELDDSVAALLSQAGASRARASEAFFEIARSAATVAGARVAVVAPLAPLHDGIAAVLVLAAVELVTMPTPFGATGRAATVAGVHVAVVAILGVVRVTNTANDAPAGQPALWTNPTVLELTQRAAPIVRFGIPVVARFVPPVVAVAAKW